jgi:hypothetical protein
VQKKLAEAAEDVGFWQKDGDKFVPYSGGLDIYMMMR